MQIKQVGLQTAIWLDEKLDLMMNTSVKLCITPELRNQVNYFVIIVLHNALQ